MSDGHAGCGAIVSRALDLRDRRAPNAERRQRTVKLMDRELLIEIGVEELPASWMPGLTRQLAERLDARLKEFRIAPGAAIESFSTPRRLTVRVAHIAERQDDLDETITGPPVSAAFGKDGQPSPAALGFARKQGVAFEQLTRAKTPKGEYLAVSAARARPQRRRRAARHPHRPPARSGVPQADALGREARGRPRRVALWPSDPLAAVPLWRARRAVHDRPRRRRRRVRRCRTSNRVR